MTDFDKCEICHGIYRVFKHQIPIRFNKIASRGIHSREEVRKIVNTCTSIQNNFESLKSWGGGEGEGEGGVKARKE